MPSAAPACESAPNDRHRSGARWEGSAASLLLAQHVPARVVMEILGHSQIALTMNTYSHVAPEVSREAADRMARALWPDEDQANDDHAAGERTGG